MAQLKISETQRTKGVILALLSTLSFSFMMIFAALNSPEIPLWEQTFFRNLIGIFVASFILIKNHQPLFGERKYWPQMFARSLFGLLAVMLLFYASRNALQADVSIMNRISMFTISIVSVVFLHERLTKMHIPAMLIAFTGAYIAGIVLCTIDDASYVERRVDISNYVLFAPIFFASIGLKTDISGLTPEILLFSVCFVVVALLTKIIGCGLAAKVCRFSWGDSLKVGVGMMTRGEVALIVAQKGLGAGVVDSVYFTAVILLIVVSSIVTPLALKGLFAKG